MDWSSWQTPRTPACSRWLLWRILACMNAELCSCASFGLLSNDFTSPHGHSHLRDFSLGIAFKDQLHPRWTSNEVRAFALAQEFARLRLIRELGHQFRTLESNCEISHGKHISSHVRFLVTW